MTILIDADGCPVVDVTLQIAKQLGVPVIILCDTAHQIEREGAQTLVFDKGTDSVDFALVNRVKPGDVVVTQDYGLASIPSPLQTGRRRGRPLGAGTESPLPCARSPDGLFGHERDLRFSFSEGRCARCLSCSRIDRPVH